MLHNSNGANIYGVDGKSWIVGERKISMWTESKCNESKCNKTVDKVEDDKTEVIESVDKTVINKVDT